MTMLKTAGWVMSIKITMALMIILKSINILDYQDATANAPFDQDQYIIFNTAVNGNLT